MFDPPYPVIVDGRFSICTCANWTDPDINQTVNGTITVEYDFEGERAIRYKLVVMDAIYNGYPVLHGS